MKQGDSFAKALLDFLALGALSKSDEPLDRWIFSRLREGIAKHKKTKGRRPSSPMWHSFISFAVSRVWVRHPELSLTKGRNSKTEVSVCSIVSEGLSKAGYPLGEARVAEIFKEQRAST
jgi:hypothetical protein